MVKVLHVIRSLDPAGGGPAEGIRQFAQAGMPLGYRAEVATFDRADAPWLREFPAPIHAFGPALGKYGLVRGFEPWLRAHASDFDAVVVNGIWQYQSLATWRALRRGETPYFVFTHGMLDPWFKTRYPLKHLKKSLYWPWGDYRVLRDAHGVLFTCEEERDRARQSFRRYNPAREIVVGYGIEPAPGDPAAQREAFHAAFPAVRGKRLLLFLSRIHPKKGCDLLIEAFARTCRSHPQVWLMMAGPGEARWVQQLKAQADAAGIAERIIWPGMLTGAVKWGALRAADAFVLPSHQENFGIAVVEAMACQTPVLISDKINIWREIAHDHAGLVESDTRDGACTLIARWLNLSDAAREELGRNALRSFQQRFEIRAAAARLVDAVCN